MRLQKLRVLYGLGIAALTVLPIHAEEPVNRSITMPAREQYRKPYDTWGGGMTPDEFQRHIKITVSPAKFPYPLLKYRLNMDSTELESGNAAPLYSQAWAECEKIYAEAEKNWYASNEYFELKKSGASQDKILAELFRAVPLKPAWPHDRFPKSVSPEDEAKFYHSMKPVYQLLDKASRLSYGDWTSSMEYKGINGSLDQLQNARCLARFLSGKADWEIRNGKYEDGIKTLRIGIALGNNVASGNPRTLVGMLVGIAIHGMMQEHIMTIASQADGPNLYAALTQIAQPADALQSALQGELSYASQTGLPSFEDIDKASPEECRAKLENGIPRFLMPGADRWNSDFEKSRFAAAICTFCYPQARDRLLAQGRAAEEIERMSVYQVVTPYVFHEFKDAYDRMLVTSTFPAGSSHTAIVNEEKVSGKDQSPVDFYVGAMSPALNAAKTACTRQHQSYELLKIIEAIRYYAAVHGGRLPESLEAIKEVPVATIDLMTGKPLGYKVNGRTAIIDWMHVGKCRLEITVEQAAATDKAEK